MFAACCLSTPTRLSLATSTTTPLISLREANAASLARNVPPPCTTSVSSSGTFDESVMMTVRSPVALTCERGDSVMSVTPVQVVGPLVTLIVNCELVLKAPLRPPTRI